VIEAQRLPKATEPGFNELYQETGLVATPHEERARWAAATAGELSRSLTRLQDVLDARVHLSVADAPTTLDAERVQPKASVLIQRRRGTSPIEESQVRALVAGAVEGLSADAVTVVQTTADAPHSAPRELARVGPITVTRDSARALKALLGSAFALDLMMAVALLVVVQRARRERA
jgi:type III secretion protein J